MTAPRWERVRALFEAVLDHPPAARDERLRQDAGGDEALLAAARQLLAAHHAAEAGAWRDPPLADDIARAAGAEVPVRIGPYRLLRELGSGGMGSVHEAEEEHPRRRVAVKLLRWGWADSRSRARFREEVELLGRLDHPGIARVFAAGELEVVGGPPQPWFSMELVPGARPLTAALADRPLRERIAAYVDVCAAVQHGHLNGIIHRDLKPANLLVGDDGRLRVIDFGIARAAAPGPGAAGRVATGPGAPLVTRSGELPGTPAYMSPEQFEGRADVRSDVWALGVVLHELLTGRLPHDTSDSGPTALERALRERPLRGLRRDAPDMPVELEWICSRALEIDPARRYASAGELGEDLSRWLAGEPVRAGAPSRAYRVARFVRRHRFGVASGAAILLLLVGGIVGTTRGMLQAREASRSAEAALELLAGLFAAPDPALDGREVRVIDALARADERLARDLADEPRVEGVLRHALGRLAHNLGQHEQAQRELLLAGERLAQAGDTDVARREALASDLALTRLELGRLDEADAALQQLLDARLAALGPQHAETARVQNSLGLLRLRQGRAPEAEALFRSAAATLTATLGPEDEQTLTTQVNLAGVLRDRDALAEAEALLVPTLASIRDSLGAAHPLTVTCLNNLASLLTQLKRFPEAEVPMREALELRTRLLPEGHAALDGTRNNLATLHILQGRFDPARELLDEVLARRAAAGQLHELVTLTTVTNLATIHALRKDGAALDALLTQLEAGDVVARALEVKAADTLENSSRFQQRAGQPDTARRLAGLAVEIRTRLQGAHHADTLLARAQLVLGDAAQSPVEDVRAELAGLYAAACEHLPAGAHARGALGHELARVLMAQGRDEEAEGVLADAAPILGSVGSAFEAQTAAKTAVELYERLGRPEDAQEWRERAAAATP
ncbi:MAG: protein kinase domain-containing protein [Planctomycetota bacterium]